MIDYSKRPGKKVEKIGEIKKNYEPTISIITPFYNGGETLIETANSVFSQTYPYFEWIIVDDGSKDKKSLNKLSKLEKMDDRIKVYHKENGGPSIARDFGISKSSKKTKYIFFLDCDDIMDKTMLECLYWTLETHEDASFAYTAMVNFGDREFIWEKYLTVEQEKFENLICISSMIKKEDLLEVGCFGIKEKGMYEDWNLWLKLLAKGKKPIRVNAPLFWYRTSNTGEFSRAKENHKRAMSYINETAKTIKNDVEIIQFPREGELYSKVKLYPNMVLPDYKKSTKTKILFIFPWTMVGGADIFNYELIKRLDKNKYESIVLTTLPNENPMRQQFEEITTEIYDMSTFLERADYLNFTDYIISSRKIDMVVVSNSTYGYYMIPSLKLKYPNIPFIDYIHSVDLADLRGGFGRCTIDVDDYLVKTYCCNNFTKKQLQNMFNKNNVETLYIGTDEKRFNPKNFNRKDLSKKYGIPNNKKIITFFARLSIEKRPEMFVSIAKNLLKERNDLFFVIAGDGPLFDKIKGQINNNIKMLGLVDSENSEEIYAISDLTVNCSSLEGLALTSYESLSMGVPVISSDVGGQSELIDSSVGATIHYNDNPTKDEYENEINEYCKEIKNVLNNLDKIKNNCRQKITKDFTLNLMASKFTNIINSTIKKEKTIKRNVVSNNLPYELALESLFIDYFYYCKTYIEKTYNIPYDEDKNNTHKVKFRNIKRKLGIFLDRHNAKKEATIILNCLRTFYHLIIDFIYLIKFIIFSIPSFFKLIYKIATNKK